MATALHSRYLHQLNLSDNYRDAEHQLTAAEIADELEIGYECEVVGEALDVTFSADAASIARLVELCDGQGIYISSVEAADDAEHALLDARVGDLTDLEAGWG